ncbi:MAG: putative hydroxymethylpyrimidine transporter CytX [Lachnospiraceae bacterium]|nr:putative hydroxymethylpyrimidine transporter CytX [Lachnospiraceae bacterium]
MSDKSTANKKLSVSNVSLIWFGAGISLAEILSGASLAGLGFGKAMFATIIGHLIGGALMFAAGMIGARTGKSAMETVKVSFGNYGGLLFALLNVIQLLGWTAIMIYDGAITANGIFGTGHRLWAVVIGVLIVIWLLIGLESLGKINTVAMGLLFILSIGLCVVIFKGGDLIGAEPDLEVLGGYVPGFGGAVELAAAMPISWLPLISDYTSNTEKPFKATLSGTVVYNLVSIFMYMIGIGAVLCLKSMDLAEIMIAAGFGIAGMLIVIFSTVTTTFLDAFSAGMSFKSITGKISAKAVAITVAVLGMIAAMIWPMDNITDFLYFIGSVFTPMIGVMIADFFILGSKGGEVKFNFANLAVWLIGFAVYRGLLYVDANPDAVAPVLVSIVGALGETVPCLIVTMAATLCVGALKGKNKTK